MGSVVFGAILSTFCEELQVFVRRGRARRIVITYMCIENLDLSQHGVFDYYADGSLAHKPVSTLDV